jgi:hypothetical protein
VNRDDDLNDKRRVLETVENSSKVSSWVHSPGRRRICPGTERTSPRSVEDSEGPGDCPGDPGPRNAYRGSAVQTVGVKCHLMPLGGQNYSPPLARVTASILNNLPNVEDRGNRWSPGERPIWLPVVETPRKNDVL